MRIIIVDDHAVVRKGVMDILSLSFEDPTFAEASTSAETLELLDSGPVDLLILDISLPDVDGLKTLEQIRKRFPEQPVLILSMHSGARYAAQALRLGATGYLTKESVPEELINAVSQVLAGNRYYPPELAKDLVSELLPKEKPKRLEEILSEREFEVFVRLARGERVMDIATVMNLSDKTVSTYRARAMQKLNLKSHTQLVRFAMQMGLVDN